MHNRRPANTILTKWTHTQCNTAVRFRLGFVVVVDSHISSQPKKLQLWSYDTAVLQYNGTMHIWTPSCMSQFTYAPLLKNEMG